jgi:peptide-methionine (S)-S-oxide reductase
MLNDFIFGQARAAQKAKLPTADEALPHRSQPALFNPEHFVSGHRIVDPLPENLEKAVFGLGCFWGAERLFWELPGVYSTAVGYAGGITAHPSYEDVCCGQTGHAEVVIVFFDPSVITYEALLGAFWEAHDPTQGMRQGNDLGTQYRSALYTIGGAQLESAKRSAALFQAALSEKGYANITTEIEALDTFYYADDYHQQYLAKNPNGYCGLAGTGACYRPED